MWAEHCDCSLLYLHNGITLARFFCSLSSSLFLSRSHTHTHTDIHTYKHTVCESMCEWLTVHLATSCLHPVYLPMALCNDAGFIPILDKHFCDFSFLKNISPFAFFFFICFHGCMRELEKEKQKERKNQRKTDTDRERQWVLFRVFLKERLPCVKSCSEPAFLFCWAAPAGLSCSLKTNLLMSKHCASFPSRTKIDIQHNMPRHHWRRIWRAMILERNSARDLKD